MKIIYIAVLMFFAVCVGAQECPAVFPDPASSYAENGEIRFNTSAALLNSDGEIAARRMRDNSRGTSCGVGPCLLSGQPSAALPLPPFETSGSATDIRVRNNQTQIINSGDFDEIRLDSNASITFTPGNYHVRRLRTGNDSQILLGGGVYWIDRLQLGNRGTISVLPGETVVIYTNNMTSGGNSQLNPGGTPETLSLFSYGQVQLGNNNTINAFVFARANFRLGDNGQMRGAVNAERVQLNNNARITYADTELESYTAGGLCTIGAPAPTPIGHWPIDVCSLRGPDATVIDLIEGNDGLALNSPGTDINGRFCQAAMFRGSGDVIEIPHSDLYQLTDGAVALWFNTADLTFSNRSADGGMTLFSKDSLGLDAGGHLTIRITQDGGIRVNHQSQSQSGQINANADVTEDTWHYLVYSFGSMGMRLYLDGRAVGSNRAFTHGMQGNQEPVILAGNASRTANQSSPVNQLTDFYRGRLDDLQLFDVQLSGRQISQLFGAQNDTCESCETDIELISHWNFDTCALGSDTEIIDIVSEHNGFAIDGAQIKEQSRFCQGLELSGDGEYVDIAHNDDFALVTGSLAIWFKAEDLNHSFASSSGHQGIFSKDHSDVGQRASRDGDFTFYVRDDGSLLWRHNNRGNDVQIFTTASVVNEGQWHHMVYSWNENEIRVHYDGVFLGSISRPMSWQNNIHNIVLGASVEQDTGNRNGAPQLRDFFYGELDDIRLYADNLSDADVQLLYEASQYACRNCSETDALLFYRFESTQDDREVIDDSTYNQTGLLTGNAQRLAPASPVSCRVLDIPLNTDARVADAVNTRLDINDVGAKGTISMWYRSNTDWNGGGARKLFDASQRIDPSQNSVNVDKYFFMSLTNDGRIAFGLEDPNDGDLAMRTLPQNFAAGEWVHIALMWDAPEEDATLYLNGTQIPIDRNAQRNLRLDELGPLDTLYIGDNRSLYLVNNMTGNSANGQIDDVRVYGYKQTRTQVLADIDDVLECNGVHHYEVTHPEQSLTCDAAPVVIKACANESCSELVSQPVTVQLNSGDWASGNPVTFTGELTTTLRQRTEQVVTLTVSASDPEYTPQAPTICTNNCDIDFVTAGLVFFDTATSASLLPDTVAQTDLGRIGLWAAKDEGGVCKALLNGARTIDFSYTCTSDAQAPYSSAQCQVPFAGVPVSGDGSGANSGQLTLTFDDEGKASFAGYQYADAGRLLLTASAEIDQTPFNSGTATFDSIPASLLFEPTMSTPQAAGAPFTIAISALGAQGAVLPGYQAGQLQANLTRLTPADGVDGLWHLSASHVVQSRTDSTFSDAPVTGFNQGVYQYAGSYFDEAGSFEALFQDAGYLGNVISSTPVTLSRFIPAYFDAQVAQPGQLANTCGAMTYIGQPFSFDLGAEPQIEITALNAQGQVTANYDSGLWQLAPGSTQIAGFSAQGTSAYAVNGPVLTDTAAMQVLVSGTDNFDGQGILTLTGPQFTYAKIATVSPGPGGGSPFAANLNAELPAAALTDNDGVCYRADSNSACQALSINSIQGAQLYYGRLRLENAYGPESETLNIPVVTEYYDTGNWLLAQQDNCSTINLAQADGQMAVTNASQGNQETDISGLFTDVTVASALNQGRSTTGDFPVGPAIDSSGNGRRGTIIITLTPGAAGERWSEYLNIDWNLDGVIDNNDFPGAAVSFGIYRGNERTLHWRERF